jgi:hypothetical protein
MSEPENMELWTEDVEVKYDLIESDEDLKKIAEAMIAYARIVPMDLKAVKEEFDSSGCESEVTEGGMVRVKQGSKQRLQTLKHYNRFIALADDEKKAFQLTYTTQHAAAGELMEQPCAIGQLTIINNAGHTLDDDDVGHIASFFLQQGKEVKSPKTPPHVCVLFQIF